MVISRGVVSDVFGTDVIVVPADALPAPLEPMRSILTEVGLPAGLLDAVETLAGLTTGVMTYGEHCDEAGCVARKTRSTPPRRPTSLRHRAERCRPPTCARPAPAVFVPRPGG